MKRYLRKIMPPLLILILLAALIQLLSAAGIIRDFVIPPPVAVLKALLSNYKLLWSHLKETMFISLLGLFLSIITGALLALAMDRLPFLYRAFYPLLVISQTIPTMVITPVIVLIFGYGFLPRLAVVLLVCFFPVAINLLQGFTAVDQDQIRLMKTMGAGEGQILWHVKLPSSLLHFFSGIKISATYAVMAAVLAEWSGGGNGLGIYMLRSKRSYSFDNMFAAIIIIVLLSLTLYYLVVLVERLSLPWVRVKSLEDDWIRKKELN